MSLHALSNQEKELGQIFTPPWVVDYILDAVGYQGTAVLNKTIMEPACGDGAFLTEIVSRYVTAAQSVGWPAEKIKEGLERHIYGIEIDKDWCIQCIYNLNAVIEPLDIEVRWNVLNANALTVGDYHGKMDYVVGNPPYVRVHNLDRATRKLLKENFFMCKKGMIDLYLAFYELGLLMLNNSGRLGYITPNSFMYNATSRAFREYVRENRLLKAIVNFKDTQLFDVSTYSAIVILDKGHRKPKFNYYEGEEHQIRFINRINFATFPTERWNFADDNGLKLLASNFNTSEKLGDIAKIQYGLATLRDRIYICHDPKPIDTQTTIFNGMPVENALLKPIIKATKYDGGAITAKLLFPYYKTSKGKWKVIPEAEMKNKYPLAYAYLLKHKADLLKRKMDKNCTEWYQFGRSQGLNNIGHEKLVVNPITPKDGTTPVKIFKIPAETFVYSGIYITAADLKEVEDILCSQQFTRYAVLVGKDLRGGYKTINTKVIKEFSISENKEAC